MDIFWYSPTDIDATEIARYSAQVLPYIAAMANVAGVSDGTGAEDEEPDWWREARKSLVRSERIPPVRGQAPMPVYHIGNNPMHLEIHELSMLEPGIIVLHDISLVDLAKCVAHHHGDPDLWKGMMYRQHGDPGQDLARHSERSEEHYNRMVCEYPLFLPFVEKCLGIVVHSGHAREMLASQLPGGTPIARLNLPYPEPGSLPSRDYSEEQLRFVFCGHVGPNRRLLEFFEAWGQLENPERIHLDVFGNVRNVSQLERAAEQRGVAEFIEFRGFVEEEELDEALRQAHFALNLRWPTMGETSASQLRYWSVGLPTLVTDVGWYAELPDEVVCKISAEDEVRSILEMLEDIVRTPDEHAQRGEAGWAYLRENHKPEEYSKALVEFAQQACEARLLFRTIDSNLVNTIAKMCDKESTLGLFRHPVDVAVALFEDENQILESKVD